MSELKESKFATGSKQIPLKSLEIHNFKSIQSARINFKPLSILVGQNSAGKSTLIQSLLLLAQNADSRDSRVLLNGPLFRGGKFTSCLNRDAGVRDFENGLYYDFSVDQDPKDENLVGEAHESMGDDHIPEGFSEFLGSDFDAIRFMFDWHVSPISPQLVRRRSESGRYFLSRRRVGYDLAIGYSIGVHPKNASAGQIRDSYFCRSNVTEDAVFQPFSLFVKSADLKEEIDPAQLAENEFNRSMNLDVIDVEDGFESLKFANLARIFNGQQRIPGLKAVSFSGMLPSSYLIASSPLSLFLLRVVESALSAPGFRNKSRIAITKIYAHNKKFKFDKFISTWTSCLEEYSAADGSSLDSLNLFKSEISKSLEPLMREDAGLDAVTDRAFEELASDTYGRLREYFESAKFTIPDFHQLLFSVVEKITSQEKYEEAVWSRSSDLRIPNLAFNLKEKIAYLGPLREDPRSSYSYSQDNSPFAPLGKKGEFTFNYIANDTELKKYVLPDGTLSERPIRLESVLKSWLEYFFGTNRLHIEPPSEHGLVVQFDGKSLENVGVGVSQILPVLTLCLIARPEQVVLLEQPELHLHPALQQKLAHFFSVLSSHGQQIIIETHSEYLVTRLRLLVVQHLLSPETVQILFAEQDKVDGTSYFPIDITEDGNMSTWPEGFFDQATDDLAKIYEKLLNLPE